MSWIKKNILSNLGLTFYLVVLFLIIIPMAGSLFYSYITYERIIQKELSDNSIESMESIEIEIDDLLMSMVKISNFIMYDSVFIEQLANNEATHYQRTRVIDDLIASITNSNIFLEKIDITIIDQEGQLYSNWPVRFGSYEHLLDKVWIKKAYEDDGYLSWSTLEPTYIKTATIPYNQISLAREIIDLRGNEVGLGLMIISIREDELRRIFNKYLNEDDYGLMVNINNNEILTYNHEKVKNLWASIEYNLKDHKKMEENYLIKSFGNKKYLINSYNLENLSWGFESNSVALVRLNRVDDVVNSISEFSVQMLFLFIIFVIIIIISISLFSSWVVKPIERLSKSLNEFTIDHPIEKVEKERMDEIGTLYKTYYLMSERISVMFEEAKYEAIVKEQYRYEALRAQVNPHFLFNTLNMIRCMAIIIKAENIVSSLDALGSLLSYGMNKGSELISLKEEIKSIDDYLFIQNTRFNNRIDLVKEIDEESLKYDVVKFILQPIIENAFIHGFSGRKEKNTITITSRLEKKQMILTVEDNGIGISESRLKALYTDNLNYSKSNKRMTGIGIANINQRIKTTYGSDYGLDLQSEEGKGTTVVIRLPLMKRGDLQ